MRQTDTNHPYHCLAYCALLIVFEWLKSNTQTGYFTSIDSKQGIPVWLAAAMEEPVVPQSKYLVEIECPLLAVIRLLICNTQCPLWEGVRFHPWEHNHFSTLPKYLCSG